MFFKMTFLQDQGVVIVSMMEKLRNAFLSGKDFCEDTAENFRETVTAAMDAAKLQYRITAKRKEINSLYAVLGRIMYADTVLKAEEKEQVKGLRLRIAAKEELLSGLEKQLRIVSGKIICPGCGRFMSDKYSYCPWCGRHTGGCGESEAGSDISGEELLDVREIEGL